MTEEIISRILVFKTNIHDEADVRKVASVINTDKQIQKWNVDLEDVDRVLRIESDRPHSGHVIQLIQQAGYNCEELPD